jgi:predicted dehydrogenase
MKRVVDLGVLGEVFYWRLEHNQNVAVPHGHWIHDSRLLGGGAIMSCLTHQIDALRWYGGQVESVACMSKTIPSRMEGEFAGVVTAMMKSGALANLAINWWTTSNAPGPNGLWYELTQACGTAGEAYFMHGRGTFVKLHQRPGVQTDLFDVDRAMKEFVPVLWPDEPGHARCIAEWIKLLRGEPAGIVTSGEESRGTVEVAEAAYLARQTGRTVRLPLPCGPRTPMP